MGTERAILTISGFGPDPSSRLNSASIPPPIPKPFRFVTMLLPIWTTVDLRLWVETLAKRGAEGFDNRLLRPYARQPGRPAGKTNLAPTPRHGAQNQPRAVSVGLPEIRAGRPDGI